MPSRLNLEAGFKASRGLAVLTVGAAVLGYTVYRTFAPFPAAPFSWVVLAAAISAAAGAIAPLIPGLLARMRGSRLLAVTTAGSHDRPAPQR